MVVPCLDALHRTKSIEVVGVVSRIDSKAKRGMKIQASAIKSYALEHHLDIITPTSLKNDEESLAWLKSKKADVLIVAAYGMILPQSWLTSAQFGAINLHASLLPRWRGAAPIERALLAGDTQTGVCIMDMDEGLDTGAIYSHCVVPILDSTTTHSLRENLVEEGSRLLIETLQRVVHENLKAIPQETQGMCYAHKIENIERRIQWNKTAQHIDRQVRTFTPKPGAYALFQGKILKIIQGEVLKKHTPTNTGEVTLSKTTMDVGCLNSTYRLLQVQPEGKRVMAAQDFIRGIQTHKGLQMNDV